jgi:PRTRC genetic system protein E
MFSELMPLLNHRPLTITVAPLSGGRIRVCVIPQTVESDERVNDKAGSHKEIKKIPDSAIKALTTPLCLEGTAPELDSGMPGQLAKYTEAQVGLHAGLQRAVTEIAEAVQAITDRNKAKSATKQSAPAKDKGRSSREAKPADETEKPMDLPLAWCVPPSTSATPTAVSQGDAASKEHEDANQEGGGPSNDDQD